MGKGEPENGNGNEGGDAGLGVREIGSKLESSSQKNLERREFFYHILPYAANILGNLRKHLYIFKYYWKKICG